MAAAGVELQDDQDPARCGLAHTGDGARLQSEGAGAGARFCGERAGRGGLWLHRCRLHLWPERRRRARGPTGADHRQARRHHRARDGRCARALRRERRGGGHAIRRCREPAAHGVPRRVGHPRHEAAHVQCIERGRARPHHRRPGGRTRPRYGHAAERCALHRLLAATDACHRRRAAKRIQAAGVVFDPGERMADGGEIVVRWLCIALALVAQNLWAQTWPTKTVRIVVPFAPGALTDIAARALAAELSEQLGQQFIVENKGGAGGTLGTNDVAKSPPDGSSFAFTDRSFMVSAGLYPKLPYDPLKDLVPVTLAVDAAAILIARLDLPAKNVRELVALAKAKPGTLTYGSGGEGSSAQLAIAHLLLHAGAAIVRRHISGLAGAIAEVLGGRIDVRISTVGAALGPVKGGKVRAPAVTGKERVPALPEGPTFAESGVPGYHNLYPFRFLPPAATPPAVNH